MHDMTMYLSMTQEQGTGQLETKERGKRRESRREVFDWVKIWVILLPTLLYALEEYVYTSYESASQSRVFSLYGRGLRTKECTNNGYLDLL
jgi:hypothetical protein